MSANQTYSGDHLKETPRQKPAVVGDVPERQGVIGHNVRYVLLFGTLGAAIGLALIAAYFH